MRRGQPLELLQGNLQVCYRRPSESAEAEANRPRGLVGWAYPTYRGSDDVGKAIQWSARTRDRPTRLGDWTGKGQVPKDTCQPGRVGGQAGQGASPEGQSGTGLCSFRNDEYHEKIEVLKEKKRARSNPRELAELRGKVRTLKVAINELDEQNRQIAAMERRIPW